MSCLERKKNSQECKYNIGNLSGHDLQLPILKAKLNHPLRELRRNRLLDFQDSLDTHAMT